MRKDKSHHSTSGGNRGKALAEGALQAADQAAVIEKLTTDVSHSGEKLISLMLAKIDPDPEDFDAIAWNASAGGETADRRTRLHRLAQAHKLVRLYGPKG